MSETRVGHDFPGFFSFRDFYQTQLGPIRFEAGGKYWVTCEVQCLRNEKGSGALDRESKVKKGGNS